MVRRSPSADSHRRGRQEHAHPDLLATNEAILDDIGGGVTSLLLRLDLAARNGLDDDSWDLRHPGDNLWHLGEKASRRWQGQPWDNLRGGRSAVGLALAVTSVSIWILAMGQHFNDVQNVNGANQRPPVSFEWGFTIGYSATRAKGEFGRCD